MENKNNITFNVYLIQRLSDGEYHVEKYIDEYAFEPSDNLKLPKGFDEVKDLPCNIDDSIKDILQTDENFILEMIKAYRDFKDWYSSCSQEDGYTIYSERYKTSYEDDLVIEKSSCGPTYAYMYDTYYDEHDEDDE